MDLPVIDVAPLVQGGASDGPGRMRVAAEIGEACRDYGFFYAVGHAVDPDLQDRLFEAGRRFFSLPTDRRARIRMELGGRAWRGWFPVGDELTSGLPDQKEGIYFGAELAPDDPRCREGWPLHGSNLFPDDDVPELRPVVLEWLDAMTALGHILMGGLAQSLGLTADHFSSQLTRDPLVLFRIFHYPPLPAAPATDEPVWSVGEHTDYGLLTILLQDDSGGLQVKSGGRWLDAPPVSGSFVCNIGDMFDRMTSGRYRSTPHRVRNASQNGRLSFPFFFDPNFQARVGPIDPGLEISDDALERWDGSSVHAFDGRYSDYLLGKVSKVFPELGEGVLP